MSSDLPEGFLYFPEFLTEREEQELISGISNTELHTFIFQGYEAKRIVARFGYNYNFEKRAFSKGVPIPPMINALIEKVSDTLSLL